MDDLDILLVPLLVMTFVFKITGYMENQHLWTLRLRISTIEHHISISCIMFMWFMAMKIVLFRQLPQVIEGYTSTIALAVLTSILLTLFNYVLPAYVNRKYLLLRWKAWSGPSRTAIRCDLVSYIGDAEDWKHLNTLAHGMVTIHPVERFSQLPSLFRPTKIYYDPTDILASSTASINTYDILPAAQSKARHGVYQPIISGQPVSLLWGEITGFQRRCSRGILSAPAYLLSPRPMLMDGVDARGMCIAAGVLARNKGLRPSTIICNLHTKGMISKFEQQSVFWPRPAKTLRSLFTRECRHYYSGLGTAFVTAAAELALLMTDAPVHVAADWLDACLEHQDMELNNTACTLGASHQDLEILYRGQYATMLASLSSHRPGIRVRPEILVYDALCQSLGMAPGQWSVSEKMKRRRQVELDALGPRVLMLIDALI